MEKHLDHEKIEEFKEMYENKLYCGRVVERTVSWRTEEKKLRTKNTSVTSLSVGYLLKFGGWEEPPETTFGTHRISLRILYRSMESIQLKNTK